jgi:hypothetical protein
MLTKGYLHHTILSYMVENGYAPTLEALCQILGKPQMQLESALLALQDYHGLVLHPHKAEIWIAHPFSNAPTNFVVRSGERVWWGNCAWCSLGIAALVGGDVSITTSVGAHGNQLNIQIINGEVVEGDLLIHMPVPMKEAWENVVYTCSTMLVFENEDQINLWCNTHNINKGDVQPISHIWQFAQRWYGNHLNPAWEKWTVSEAKSIFKEFGFSHPIWSMEESQSRF